VKRPSVQNAWLLACAGIVFGATWLYLRSVERRALECAPIRDQIDRAGRLRPTADVARAVKAMKLVTIEIDTAATAERDHESWRGDVSASVTAPVRLLFGTDLSRMEADAVSASPLTRHYVVRIPPPERIATEVDTGQEDATVKVGWARLRTRAGEYWLGQARRALYEEARRLMLPPDQAAAVRHETREQVAAMVRGLVGPGAPVTVLFADEAGAPPTTPEESLAEVP
jgi:hypothetical protein